MDFNILVILLSLIGLMTFAYRGFSVILELTTRLKT